MLTVSERAHGALAEKAKRDWLLEATRTVLGRHPAWSAQQANGAVEALCLKLDAFSEEFDLNKHESFLALVDLVVETGITLDLTTFQRYIMERSGFSEESAVALFCADVRRGSHLRLVGPADLGFTLPAWEDRP